MTVEKTHVGASLRLLDGENAGIMTIGRARANITLGDLAQLFAGLNSLTAAQSAAARLTVTEELKRA